MKLQKRTFIFLALMFVVLLFQYFFDKFCITYIIRINDSSGLTYTDPSGLLLLFADLGLGYLLYLGISYREIKVWAVSISKFSIYITWAVLFFHYLITQVLNLNLVREDSSFSEEYYLWGLFLCKSLLLVCFYFEHFLRINVLAYRRNPRKLQFKPKNSSNWHKYRVMQVILIGGNVLPILALIIINLIDKPNMIALWIFSFNIGFPVTLAYLLIVYPFKYVSPLYKIFAIFLTLGYYFMNYGFTLFLSTLLMDFNNTFILLVGFLNSLSIAYLASQFIMDMRLRSLLIQESGDIQNEKNNNDVLNIQCTTCQNKIRMEVLEMLFLHKFLFCENCGAKIYRVEVLPTNYQELFRKHQNAIDVLSKPLGEIKNFSEFSDNIPKYETDEDRSK